MAIGNETHCRLKQDSDYPIDIIPSLLILKQICEGRHCRNTLRAHKAHENVRLSILDIFLFSANVIISNLIYSKLEDKFIGLRILLP